MSDHRNYLEKSWKEQDEQLMKETEEEVRGMLQGLAKHIAGQIPSNHGFALLVFTIGEGGTLQYVGNCNRLDIMQAMREFIAVNREERNFQRDIGEEGHEEFEQWWQQEIGRDIPKKSSLFFPLLGAGKSAQANLSVLKNLAQDAFIAGRSTA
jgi:hypothetical protein